MVKKLNTAFIVALFALLAPGVKAQDTLGIDSTSSFIAPDTANFFDTLHYEVVIRNFGVNQVSIQNLYLMCKINNGIPFILDSIIQAQIPGLGTLTHIKIDSTLPSRYTGGGNIILVWPDAPSVNVGPADTMMKVVYIDPLSSRSGKFSIPSYQIFPNPANDQIRIRVPESESPVRFILSNLSGKFILERNFPLNEVDIGQLPSGTYIARIERKEGLPVYFKVLLR